MPDSKDRLLKSRESRGERFSLFSSFSFSVLLHGLIVVGLFGFLGDWGVREFASMPEAEITVELIAVEPFVDMSPVVTKKTDPVVEPEVLPDAVVETDTPLPEKADEKLEDPKKEEAKKKEVASPVVQSTATISGREGGVGSVRSYTADVAAKINAHKFYPRAARQRREEGSVVLAFTVLRDGQVDRVRIVQSSYSHLLDRAALSAVKNAAPFNPPPSYLSGQMLNFKLPIRYRLKDR